jgi:ATP-binding protein involved in chromosome partitioning
VKLLGEIPINTKVRIGGDEGIPIVSGLPDSDTAKIFTKISKELIKEINLINTSAANSQDIVIEI